MPLFMVAYLLILLVDSCIDCGLFAQLTMLYSIGRPLP